MTGVDNGFSHTMIELLLKTGSIYNGHSILKKKNVKIVKVCFHDN